MKKLLDKFTVYGGGGSGADAPPVVLECDFNSEKSPSLDYNEGVGNWDFN